MVTTNRSANGIRCLGTDVQRSPGSAQASMKSIHTHEVEDEVGSHKRKTDDAQIDERSAHLREIVEGRDRELRPTLRRRRERRREDEGEDKSRDAVRGDADRNDAESEGGAELYPARTGLKLQPSLNQTTGLLSPGSIPGYDVGQEVLEIEWGSPSGYIHV